MADILLELLDAGHTGPEAPSTLAITTTAYTTKLQYLDHLAGQPQASLLSAEPHALAQSSHSTLLSLQAISKRSHKTVVDSATRHATLATALPRLVRGTTQLQNAIPKVDSEALRFSATYSKASDNDNLLRRRRALLLLGNVERLVDVLELPALLSSAIAAVPPNYAMALDINSHIRRLHLLYPESPLIASVFRQASEAIDRLTADLVNTLKIPSLKLAAALRTVSWLRRVLPGFDTESGIGRESQERALSLLFLRCRLATLATTLDALQPLQELANEEKARQTSSRNAQSWSGGQQTERFLKRYVEIFREQSFSIVSMFNSIFGLSAAASGEPGNDPLQPLPSVLSSFPLYLVEKLLETLHEYLPAVKDQAARDSILTQVLYCSGSMGRLGGDFGMLLPGIRTGYVQTAPEDSGNVEWVDIVKRHRLLAGRLDSIIGDYKGTAIKGT